MGKIQHSTGRASAFSAFRGMLAEGSGRLAEGYPGSALQLGPWIASCSNHY